MELNEERKNRMEIRNLKVGNWFEKHDGAICRLDLLNDCRARIHVSNARRKKQVDLWGKKEDAEGTEDRNVSPGTEVIRVLNEQDLQTQPKAEGRGKVTLKEGRIMATLTEAQQKKFNELFAAVKKELAFDGKVEQIAGPDMNRSKAMSAAPDWTKTCVRVRDDEKKQLGYFAFEFQGDRNRYKKSLVNEPKERAEKTTTKTKTATEKKTKKVSKKNGKVKVLSKAEAKKVERKLKSRDKKVAATSGLPFSKDKQLGKKTEERIGK